jgi:putative colanic acid biosynthesis UDP-glucose lipid carrier transferase
VLKAVISYRFQNFIGFNLLPTMLFSGNLRGLKKYQYTAAIPLALILFEFTMILLLLDVGKNFLVGDVGDVSNYLLLSFNVALCWTLANLLVNSFKVEHFVMVRTIIVNTSLSTAMYVILLALILGLGTGGLYSIGILIQISMSIYVLMLVTRLFLHRIFKVLKHMSSNRRKAIILGNTARGKELSRYFLTTTSLPIAYTGFFDDTEPVLPEEKIFYLGRLDQVKTYCLEKNVYEIYYAVDNKPELFSDMLNFADKHFIFLGIVPDIQGFDHTRKVDTIVYNDSRIPVISSRKGPLHLFENYQAKRIFDIIFAGTVLTILAATLFPVIAIAIKMSSPGPVFFKQRRPGKKNKLFWCYKFRTMRLNDDAQKQASKNDSRITKVGAFLRKTSLDELPQFINVLIGDMSVVGPRPNLIVHLEEYPRAIKEYESRHWVTPGITGFAQVNGFRGETKEIIQMQKRVDCDLQYIENWSLTLDLEIIGRTVLNIIKGEENAY